MKRLLIFCVLWGAGTLAAHSQTITVMAEQLAELQLYEHTTSAGYRIAETSVQQIGQITGKEYQLHENYYNSLKNYSTIKIKPNDTIISTAQLAGRLRPSRPRPIYRRPAGRTGAGQGKA